MKNLIGQSNGTFTIISQRENKDGDTIVFGYRVLKNETYPPVEYVSWEFINDSYFCGHYNFDFQLAVADYYNRPIFKERG